MVAPGNKDGHRRTYSNGIKAMETQKWGSATARERYGAASATVPKPPHDCYPQFRQDQRPDRDYDAPNNWVRDAGENAENRPGYVHGYKGKK
jgi:hypothetical protein